MKYLNSCIRIPGSGGLRAAVFGRGLAVVLLLGLVWLLGACTPRPAEPPPSPTAAPACLDPAHKPPLARLDLSHPWRVRTALIINPRLPRLTDDELKRALATLRAAIRDKIGAEVEFETVGEWTIDEYFRRYLPTARYERASADIVDVAAGGGSSRLFEALRKSSADLSTEEISALLGRRRLFEGRETPTDRDGMLLEAARYMTAGLLDIYAGREADGRPTRDRFEYLQFVAWCLIALCQSDFEFVVTNEPIASAEVDVPLAVALRSGITTGVTEQSQTPLGGMITMSTYPFLAQTPFFARQRGKAADPAELFGYYSVHEFGHLLQRYGHPAGAPSGCYMTPATSLDYGAWVDAVKSGSCPPDLPILENY